MSKPVLTSQDFIDAAAILNCSVAAIKAVAEVESSGGGFLSTGEPKILFERHIFSSRTRGLYDRSNPGVSSPNPVVMALFPFSIKDFRKQWRLTETQR